jgi:hypothetical protein
MTLYAEFIAYCLEEYKAAKGIAGKEAIDIFKKYKIIDYIVTCYGALHTMGGLAITEDIDSLIEGMEKNNTLKHSA